MRVNPGELGDAAGLGQRADGVDSPQNEFAAENLKIGVIFVTTLLCTIPLIMSFVNIS